MRWLVNQARQVLPPPLQQTVSRLSMQKWRARARARAERGLLARRGSGGREEARVEVRDGSRVDRVLVMVVDVVDVDEER